MRAHAGALALLDAVVIALAHPVGALDSPGVRALGVLAAARVLTRFAADETADRIAPIGQRDILALRGDGARLELARPARLPLPAAGAREY